MVAPYPETDARGVKDLREDLKREVVALVPALLQPPQDGEFGHAFYELALRMAAQVTTRLNKTAQRDAIAFFDALDIPPMAPRAAEAPLVFTLAEKKDEPVAVPKGTQVGADADGDEVIFETLHELTVTPARLEHLAAVDLDTDVIEEAPANVRSSEPPAGPFPIYRLATFAAAGSTTIQITPAIGLEAGDLIRIGKDGRVYRVEKMQGDLCTIDPKLDAPADPDTGVQVEKVMRFDAFTLRNVQAHQVYVGHSELLNLEQRALITLVIEPASVMRRLGEMGVSAALWGKPDPGQTVGEQVIAATGGEDPKPDWQPLDFDGVTQNGISFVKSWTGKVEKFKVDGSDSLWLRLALNEKIPNSAGTGTRVNTLKIKIASIVDPDPLAPDPNLTEGSETIERGFHNSTPLSVGTRFLPFGPEPQRFDTFAIAAPEALSKKGATVTLDVRLVDATVEALTLALKISGPQRAYGIGSNGGLQAFAFETLLRWQQIDHPKKADESDDQSLRLDPKRPFQVIQIDSVDPSPLDLIIACDKKGRVWSQVIANKTDQNASVFEARGWNLLWPLLPADTAEIQDLVLLRAAGTPATLFVVAVARDRVRSLTVTPSGLPAASQWTPLTVGPVLDDPNQPEKCALTAVLTEDWPAPPNIAAPEIVLVDAKGAVWNAVVSPGNGTANWSQIFPSGQASSRIRPAAFRKPASLFFLAAASTNRQLFGFWDDGFTTQMRYPLVSMQVLEGSTILCLPKPRDVDWSTAVDSDQPVITAFGKDGGPTSLFLWTHQNRIVPFVVPANDLPTTTPNAIWLPGANPSVDLPTLILGGVKESFVKAALSDGSETVSVVALHDILRRTSGGQAPNYVELNPGTAQSAVRPLSPADRVIPGGPTDYYKLARNVGLTGSTPYRFLETLNAYGGTVSSGTQLALGTGDTDTQTGSVLIINPATAPTAHTVSGVTANVATFAPALANGPVNYEVTQVLQSVTATPFDLATLVELTSGATTTKPGISIPGGLPSNRPIADVLNHWLRLGAAWPTPPVIPAQGTNAILKQKFDLEPWVVEHLERGYQNPELAWRYFDGNSWKALGLTEDSTFHLARGGEIKFTVPIDLSQTDIGGQKDYWISASLIGGDYGRAQYVVTATTSGSTTTQTITIDRSNLHPPEIRKIEATFKLQDEVPPEFVLVENNGAILNQTQAAAEAQASFELFEGLRALDPKLEPRSIFLGFSKRFDVNPLMLYADVDEQSGEGALQAFVLTQSWSPVSVEDETAAFRRSGLVRVSMPAPPVRTSLFGRALYWLRLAPKSVTDWKPRIKGLYVNAVAAEQAKTVVQEILGSSVGEPNQTYPLSETPVILRERAGVASESSVTPLDVELRIREYVSEEERDQLNRTLSRGDIEGVKKQPDIPGDWVLWQRVDSFVGQDGDARVFRLDPATGTVGFGDGQQGKIPPAGRDAIRAFRYQQGGGKQGNVGAYAIKNLKTALESVEAVTNPVEASGGIDAPGIEQLIATAPTRLLNANRALSGADMEALAVSSSPNVVRARYIMPRDATDKMRLAVAVRTGQKNPRPSIARRKALAKYIVERAAGTLEPDDLDVIPPEYARVTVTVELLADSADVMSEVERAASERLAAFLDPIDGGPEGNGWPFGRRVWPSDIYRIVSAIPGVDRITSVVIVPDKGVDLDQLPAAALICAAENGLKVHVEAGGAT